LALLINNHGGAVIADDTSLGIEAVEQWRSVSDSYRSIHVKWTQTIPLEPGAEFGYNQRSFDDEGKPFPPEPLVLVTEHEFRSDDDGWMWKSEGMKWDNQVERVVQERTIYLRRNDEFYILHDLEEFSDDLHDRLGISPGENGLNICSMPQIVPIVLLQAPFEPQFGPLRPERYTFFPEETSQVSDDMIEVEFRFETLVDRLSLSKKLGWLPVRMQGGPLHDLTISYDRTSDPSLLQSWSYHRKRDGSRPDDRFTSEVTFCRVNTPVGIANYDLQIPNNCEIKDTRTGERERSIHKTNESPRPITKAEELHDISFPDLANSQPDELVGVNRQSSSWSRVATIAGFVFIAMLLGWRAWRRPLDIHE
jgi:hypothetical protein